MVRPLNSDTVTRRMREISQYGSPLVSVFGAGVAAADADGCCFAIRARLEVSGMASSRERFLDVVAIFALGS